MKATPTIGTTRSTTLAQPQPIPSPFQLKTEISTSQLIVTSKVKSHSLAGMAFIQLSK